MVFTELNKWEEKVLIAVNKDFIRGYMELDMDDFEKLEAIDSLKAKGLIITSYEYGNSHPATIYLTDKAKRYLETFPKLNKIKIKYRLWRGKTFTKKINEWKILKGCKELIALLLKSL